jgi:hypothetical protein
MNTISKSDIFLGVVVDNVDPSMQGKIKAKVLGVTDRLKDEDLLWSSPRLKGNGTQYDIPSIGKIVGIQYPEGNRKFSVYMSTDHYNINITEILSKLGEEERKSFLAICVDHATQIYRTKEKGLIIDHEYTNINIDKNGNILLNLRDSDSVITLGSSSADEPVILGEKFFTWLDKFTDSLINMPYMGNMGAPVVSQPNLINSIMEYKSMRSEMLSQHVFVSDNGEIKANKDRVRIEKEGDDFLSNSEYTPTNSTTFENDYTPESDYEPDGENDNPAAKEPNDPSKDLGQRGNQTPYTKQTNAALLNHIRRAVDYTMSIRLAKKGMCARGSYNCAYNFVHSMRNKSMSKGMKLAAGGNARDNSYHNNLKKLGYIEIKRGDNLSKNQLINILNNSNEFGIGDVVVYWGVTKSRDNYAKYGHTQIFTAGQQSNNSRNSMWATDNHDNYGKSFVYGAKTCDNWGYIHLKAPQG